MGAGHGLTGCACVRRVQDGKDESKGNEVKIGEALPLLEAR